MCTIHIVFNAHLDPVWLWPWTTGVDEYLNPCLQAIRLGGTGGTPVPRRSSRRFQFS